MPKLSIIIPTFNSAATIQRCLSSIRSQVFADFEVVIQDGGSSDRTLEMIQEFEAENPDVRIELQQEPDRGPYDAMNKGMSRARGEWLLFLGSDDELYDANVLKRIFESRYSKDSDVIYGNVKMVGHVNSIPDGYVYDGRFDLGKLLLRNICHQSIFYRAAFARGVGSYNPEYIVKADWDFNMRCWATGCFQYVNVIVARFHSGGISSAFRPDPRFQAEVDSNIIRYFGDRAKVARKANRFFPRRVARVLGRKLGINL